MTVRGGWALNPGQTREDTRLAPVGTWTPTGETTTRGGVVPGGAPFLLTGSSASSMTATIGVGRAVVPGTSAQGAYPMVITVAETINVPDGHASLTRIDTVWLVTYDQLYDTSGTTAHALVYQQGTASATPTAPTAPATGTAYLRLYDIYVPAGASAGVPITWATAVTDRRVYVVAAGGIGLGTDTAGVYVGQYRDTGSGLQRWSGTAWDNILFPAGSLLTSLSEFRSQRTTIANTAYSANLPGDANVRYRVQPDGKIEWGDGTAGRDVNLYRSAPNILTTDDSLTIGGALTVGSTPTTTYTPTVTGGGTATWTTQTGRYYKLGKIVVIDIQLQVNAAGSGTANVQVDLPSIAASSTIGTVFTMRVSEIYTGYAIKFSGATGATIDRLRSQLGATAGQVANLTGVQLTTGMNINISGVYVEV